MHPSQLSDLLIEESGSPISEPEMVHAYASLMLRVSTQKGKKHKRAGNGFIPDGSISLPYQYFRKLFGANGFKKLNNHFGCIDHTPNWSLNNAETRAYWLTDQGYALIDEARLNAFEGRPNILLDADGSPIKRRSNGVLTARDSTGRNAATNASIRWAIPVNMAEIESVLEVGVSLVFPECSEERLDRIDSTIRSIHACAMNDNIGHGYLPQIYQEVESGRLYGRHDLSLQNVVKEAKQTALCGAYEYDFSNCHFRLLAVAAEEFGFEPRTLTKYIENPRLFRQALADRIGIGYKDSKKCLLALLYGATQSLWHDCAIPRAIGSEKACLLYADSDFDALGLEILEVGDLLLQHADRRPNGAIINCRRKACKGRDKRKLAHLLQGKESELLHIVIEQYEDSIQLLQHDGFVLSHYVDPREIEAEISHQTGIEMPVTCKRLSLLK